MRIPRLVIAGTHSGVGKTSIATGLMAAMTAAGHRVQPFKVGPDYIDPGYHYHATGRISRNLDAFMMPENTVREVFLRAAAGAEIAVIEGVMGLYDGKAGATTGASTAHIAKLMQAPVILVLDVRSTAQSAAAMVLGYRQLDPQVQLAGVILNQVGSVSHYRMVQEAVEGHTGIPVVGHLMRGAIPSLPSRHLGLVPTGENRSTAESVKALAQSIGAALDMERLWAIARAAPELVSPQKSVFAIPQPGERVMVALARDDAFNFYYQDGLDLLSAYGADLIPFSPLSDCELPAGVAGLILGGGFPEVFAEELSANRSLLENIRAAVNQGMPVYAECGGMMYLTRGIRDFHGTTFTMVGAIPAVSVMTGRLAGMGYRKVTLLADSVLSPRGTEFCGHEFHYSVLDEAPDAYPWAYRIEGQEKGRMEGYNRQNVLASYIHLHLAGYPAVAGHFLERCRRYHREGKERNTKWVL